MTDTLEASHSTADAQVAQPAQSAGALVESRQAPAPVARETPLLALILRAASDDRVHMDKFERLLATQEKLEARAAQIAFNSAFADAKSEFVPIVRNATGHNDKKFADLSAISKVVDPILGRHGLSYRFRTSQSVAISVTCIISHREGHSEENTLSGPPDKTGNKNEVQAIGSTQKYLMRYTLEGALGLATTEEDDGKAASGKAKPEVTAEEFAALRELLVKTNTTEEKFLETYEVASVEALSGIQYGQAFTLLNQKVKKLARAAAEQGKQS